VLLQEHGAIPSITAYRTKSFIMVSGTLNTPFHMQ
jgi:hypothetical protein